MSRFKAVRKRNRTTTAKVRGRAAPVASHARGAASTAAASAGTAAVTAAGAASHAAVAARKWAAPRVESAIDQTAQGVDTAVVWARPRVEQAKDWAAPRVDTARDWAAPRVENAKDWAAPRVAGALAASEPARKEAMSRGAAAVAALKGELAPPASDRLGAGPAPRSSGSAFGRRLGQFLMLLGAVGGAFAGWKNYSAKQKSEPEPWSPPSATPQSVRPLTTTPDNPATVTHLRSTGGSAVSSTTSGAPVGGTSSGVGGGLGDVAAPATHDAAGASPDEAIADSAAAVEEGRKP